MNSIYVGEEASKCNNSTSNPCMVSLERRAEKLKEWRKIGLAVKVTLHFQETLKLKKLDDAADTTEAVPLVAGGSYWRPLPIPQSARSTSSSPMHLLQAVKDGPDDESSIVIVVTILTVIIGLQISQYLVSPLCNSRVRRPLIFVPVRVSLGLGIQICIVSLYIGSALATDTLTGSDTGICRMEDNPNTVVLSEVRSVVEEVATVVIILALIFAMMKIICRLIHTQGGVHVNGGGFHMNAGGGIIPDQLGFRPVDDVLAEVGPRNRREHEAEIWPDVR